MVQYFVFYWICAFSIQGPKHFISPSVWPSNRDIFVPTEMKNFTSWGAGSVSHCDSEAINVEIIQTGCVCLPQACPYSESRDRSAQEHTSSSYRGKKMETTPMFIWAYCSWEFSLFIFLTRTLLNRMLSYCGWAMIEDHLFTQFLVFLLWFIYFPLPPKNLFQRYILAVAIHILSPPPSIGI